MKKNFLKTIVAAVDTSSASHSMFKEALVLASSIQARVVVVSVTPVYEGNMNRFFIKNADRQLSEPFTRTLEDAADYASSLGLKMDTVHRMGKPCDEIVAVAREEKAGLIVLGSSKRLQVERMLLGRTIEEIIINSPCDVLLIPGESEIRFGKILVGIDGSLTAEEAGKRAFDVALSYGSEVHALYAIDLPTDRSLRYGVSKDEEQKAAKVLKEYILRGERLGIRVSTEIRWNTAEKCIADYAQNKGIDLIVIGSKLEEGLFDMFSGSVVERIASLAACPILVAKQLVKGEGSNIISFLSEVSKE